MNAPAPPSPEQLRHHLQADQKALETLLQLLHAERDACQHRQLDQLDDIIQRKARALKQLEASATQRSEWVKRSAARGATLDERWRFMLRRSGADLENSWDQLQRTLLDCQRENAVNGKILARQQRTVEQINLLLKGAPRATTLYGAAGRAQLAGSPQLRDEA